MNLDHLLEQTHYTEELIFEFFFFTIGKKYGKALKQYPNIRCSYIESKGTNLSKVVCDQVRRSGHPKV